MVPSGQIVEGHLIRYSVATGTNVPYLPGRLSIASGFDNGSEFRFVQTPGAGGNAVTFGRHAGAMFRHVQLEDDSVADEQARMDLHNGRWHLLNLAHTNTTKLDGVAMFPGEERELTDGQSIEMGDVLFIFQAF